MTFGSPLPAFRLLTRIPIPATRYDEADDIERSVGYFPLVGLAIGAILAGLDLLMRPWLPSAVVDVLLLIALAMLNGGLHLDGLADCADGLLCVAEPARRLEILRDSHVGAFGVIALVLVLLLQYSALSSVADPIRWRILLLLGVVSRWALVLLAAGFSYARPSGTGKAVHQGATRSRTALATAIALVMSLALAGLSGLLLLAVVAVVAFAFGRFAANRLGGLTGDVYGAGVVLSETAILVVTPLLLVWHLGTPG